MRLCVIQYYFWLQRPPSSSLSYGGPVNDDVRSPGTPGPLSQPPASQQSIDGSDPGKIWWNAYGYGCLPGYRIIYVQESKTVYELVLILGIIIKCMCIYALLKVLSKRTQELTASFLNNGEKRKRKSWKISFKH